MPLPPALATVMVAFQPLFSKPVFERVLVLTVGALLAVRTRTVTAALRVTGRDDASFSAYHRVLSRARWSCREAARVLLGLLIARFVPHGPLIVGLDDTVERRWGPKIAARGIYRDPVRSSRGHFVKASGLRWLSLSVLAEVPWAGRVWALPFLTVLCPSERYYRSARSGRPRTPKKLTDHARQAVLQVARWLGETAPGRRLVVVADTGFAAIRLLAAMREHATVVTRLRLDAALYDPAPPRRSGTLGRPRKKGARQPTLAARLSDPATRWQRLVIGRWYGERERLVEIATGTAVWYHAGMPPVPLRWVIVRDPGGAVEPKGFLCTDRSVEPQAIIAWYVRLAEVDGVAETVGDDEVAAPVAARPGRDGCRLPFGREARLVPTLGFDGGDEVGVRARVVLDGRVEEGDVDPAPLDGRVLPAPAEGTEEWEGERGDGLVLGWGAPIVAVPPGPMQEPFPNLDQAGCIGASPPGAHQPVGEVLFGDRIRMSLRQVAEWASCRLGGDVEALEPRVGFRLQAACDGLAPGECVRLGECVTLGPEPADAADVVEVPTVDVAERLAVERWPNDLADGEHGARPDA